MVRQVAVKRPEADPVQETAQQTQQAAKEISKQLNAQPSESPRQRQARELKEAAANLEQERIDLERRRAEANRKGQKQLFRDLGDRIDQVREQRSRFLDRSRNLLGQETISDRQQRQRQAAREILGRELTQAESSKPSLAIGRAEASVKAISERQSQSLSQQPEKLSQREINRLISEQGIASTERGTLLQSGDIITPQGRLITRQQASVPASFEGRQPTQQDLSRITQALSRPSRATGRLTPIASSVGGGTVVETDQGQITISRSPQEAAKLTQSQLQAEVRKVDPQLGKEVTFSQFVSERTKIADREIERLKRARDDAQFIDPQTGLPISKQEAIARAEAERSNLALLLRDAEGKPLPREFGGVKGVVTAQGFEPTEDVGDVFERLGREDIRKRRERIQQTGVEFQDISRFGLAVSTGGIDAFTALFRGGDLGDAALSRQFGEIVSAEQAGLSRGEFAFQEKGEIATSPLVLPFLLAPGAGAGASLAVAGIRAIPLVGRGVAAGAELGAAGFFSFQEGRRLRQEQEQGRLFEASLQTAGFIIGGSAGAGLVGPKAPKAKVQGRTEDLTFVSRNFPVERVQTATTPSGARVEVGRGIESSRIRLPDGRTVAIEGRFKQRIGTRQGVEVRVTETTLPRREFTFRDPRTGKIEKFTVERQTVETIEALRPTFQQQQRLPRGGQRDITEGILTEFVEGSSRAISRTVEQRPIPGARAKEIDIQQRLGLLNIPGIEINLAGVTTGRATAVVGRAARQPRVERASPAQRTDIGVLISDSIQRFGVTGTRRPTPSPKPPKSTREPTRSSLDVFDKALGDAGRTVTGTQRPQAKPQTDIATNLISSISRTAAESRFRGRVSQTTRTRGRVTQRLRQRTRTQFNIPVVVQPQIPSLGIQTIQRQRQAQAVRIGQLPRTRQTTTTLPRQQVQPLQFFPPLPPPPRIRFPEPPRRPSRTKKPGPIPFPIPGTRFDLGGILGSGPDSLVSRRTGVEDFTRFVFG